MMNQTLSVEKVDRMLKTLNLVVTFQMCMRNNSNGEFFMMFKLRVNSKLEF